MRWVGVVPVALAITVCVSGSAWAASPATPSGTAPGSPGAVVTWTPADKHGFGTSATRASKAWFTLEGGELTEVYYPRIDTPSLRDLQFVVTDGHSFVEQERTSSTHKTVQTDPRSLSYEQVNTDLRHRWRLTKTYVTHPRRATVLVKVRFESLTRRPYHLYVVANPALDNGSRETGTCSGSELAATIPIMGAALITRPSLRDVSCGYAGTSDGWTDLRRHRRMTWHYHSAPRGDVVLTGATALTGRPGHRDLTLALAFASATGTAPRIARAALSAARASLHAGFAKISRRYAAGWHGYLRSLKAPPASLQSGAEQRAYADSELVLAASEDKVTPGAYVASPTMPWQWATGLQSPSGPYHLVWARDLYEIATALIADGDVAGARRALHFLLYRQQKHDGSFPQNSDVRGRAVLPNLQLDEVADPMILAWQLGEDGAATWSHVRRAANFLIDWHDKQGHHAPYSPQERWENQPGYSPATIASEIAGLVCAAAIAQHNGDSASAARYLTTADAWQKHLNGWTLTTNGPFAQAYYLRLSKSGNPDSGVKYKIGDSGPSAIDQRDVVDPSFLELVRLGVLAANDPNIVSTLAVVDKQLSFSAVDGSFWHRYSDDGYGEQRNGAPWNVTFPPNSRKTIGRVWPLLTGERGEYELAAGSSAAPQLAAMAATANDAGFLPEQVWDGNPPTGKPGFRAGTPTFSATPLAWTHAQFIRLAWSITAGRPVETPSVVACRYALHCTG